MPEKGKVGQNRTPSSRVPYPMHISCYQICCKGRQTQRRALDTLPYPHLGLTQVRWTAGTETLISDAVRTQLLAWLYGDGYSVLGPGERDAGGPAGGISRVGAAAAPAGTAAVQTALAGLGEPTR